MDLEKLNIAVKKPALYEKGDSIMWTDPYISKRLLDLHLNLDIDSASRSLDSINRTIEFILKFCTKSSMTILDLGCGPGLYLEKLAESGHRCTGIDFSKNSISYAVNQAKAKGLDISYKCQDYLELDFEDKYDLIILIYTDIGVLLPDERDGLLSRIYRALKPDGVFIFDVLNDKNIDLKFQENQAWSYEFSGFWDSAPYLELAHGFHYPENRVFLKQHTLIDESERIRNYRFWIHYFNDDELGHMLSSKGFKHTLCKDTVLPFNDIWDGENVTFCVSNK